MSSPLAEYLSALEARDARERAHEEYINAYTKLADRTANQTSATQEPAPSPSISTQTLTPKGKTPAPPELSLAQLRAELSTTQRTRSTLESQLSTLTASLSALQATSTAQQARIDSLEKTKAALERRGKDRVDELKGKGKFVEEIQDEMVAMNLQLNMAEQEKERLKGENEELTRRWVKRMEEEARSMNERSGWEDQASKGR